MRKATIILFILLVPLVWGQADWQGVTATVENIGSALEKGDLANASLLREELSSIVQVDPALAEKLGRMQYPQLRDIDAAHRERAAEILAVQDGKFSDIDAQALAFFIKNYDEYARYLDSGQSDEAFRLYSRLLRNKDYLSQKGVDLSGLDLHQLLDSDMVVRYRATDEFQDRQKQNEDYADGFNFNRPLGCLSKKDDRFTEDGIFGKFSPEDEVIEKRTFISKKFRVTDDHIVSIIGGPFHYEDEFGALQDIDLSIKSIDDPEYPYQNRKNSFTSAFSNDGGVKVSYKGQDLFYGIQPTLALDGREVGLSTGVPELHDSAIVFDGVMEDASLEYAVTLDHVQHKLVVRDRGLFRSGEDVVLREQFSIPDGAELRDGLGIITGSREINGSVLITMDTIGLFSFDPPRVWDATFEGEPRYHMVAENIIEPTVTIEHLGGNEYIYSMTISGGWLASADRVYPVSIDPTVTIPPGSTYPGYTYPWSTEVFYVRACQYIYHSSDIGYSGDVQSIAFQQSASNGRTNTNVWVKMKHTSTYEHGYPNTFETGLSDCGTSTTYTWTSGTGWRTMSFASDFSYSTSYNLLTETHQYLTSVSSYGSGGGWYYISGAPYYGHRWGTRSVSGNVWPLDPYETYTDINFGSNVAVARLDIYIAPSEHCYTPPTYDFGIMYPSASWITTSGSFGATGCRVYCFYLQSDRQYDFTCCSSDGVGGSGTTGDIDFRMYNSSGTQQWYIDGNSSCGYDATTLGTTYEEWSPPSSGYYYLKVEEYYDGAGSYTLAYKYTAAPTDHCYDCPTYDYGTYYPATSWNTHSGSFASTYCRFYRFYLYTDRVYSFTTGCDGGSSADFDTYLELYNSSCSIVSSNDDACGAQSQIDYEPTSSGYYYLKVRGYGSAAGSYTLAYRYQTPCETPGTPTTYTPTGVTSSGASFSWSAGSPTGDPTVTYYWAVGTSSSVTYESGYTARGTTTGTTASTSALSADTDYYFNVKACTSCDGSCSSYGTARYFHTSTAEHCYSCPTYDYGTYYPSTSWNTHSTSFGSDGCRWYRFYLYSGSGYSFTTGCDGGSTADFDTYLELYNSSCSMVESNDDACGVQSQIDYDATSTGYYYLKVRGFSSSTYGSYTLAYRENPCETPGTPTVSAPTGVTETTASFSWTAGSPVGDPTVTYYWAVGTGSGVTYESGYLDRGTTTGTTASTSALSSETGYYITVKACTSCDGTCSSYASPYNFITPGASCSAPTSVSASSDVTSICSSGSVTFQYAGHTGGICSGSWQYEWRNGSGTPVRSWSTTANYTATISSTTTYYLYMRCSACTGDVSPASTGVTVTVYNTAPIGTWTGYEDDEWTNPQNWGGCTAPTISTDVTIPNTPMYGRFPKVNTADGTCVCHDLTNDGTVNGGSGNRLSIYGDFMNNGTFTRETGIVIFDGADAEQHIGGIYETSFYDVEINKTSGTVILDRNVTIYENLNMLYPGPHTVQLYPYKITFIP